MKIRHDDNYNLIAFAAGSEIEQDIISELINRGVILEDDESVYGETIKHSEEYRMSDEQIHDILEGLGIEVVPGMVQAFRELILMGDGDCECCGCDMELCDSDSVRYYGDGLREPIEYDTLSETYRCPYCGFRKTIYL